MRVTPAAWRPIDWKRYLDYLRLLNVTQVAVGTSDLYNPLEPASAHNRCLWETWRDAARYAQRLGMKFCISFQFNQTPLEYWWKYPDKRVTYRSGYTQAIGNGLCWSRGKEEIVALWPFMFDFFKEVDAVQIFFNDYGSLCMCDACLEDPAGRALEAVRIGKEAWKKANPDGEFYFWSWVFEWYDLPHFKPLVEGVQRKRPAMKTILDEMPRDLVWVDPNSALYKLISGTLAEPDGLLAAKKAGFDPIEMLNYLGPLRRKIDYWAESLPIRRARIGANLNSAEEAKPADPP